MIISTMRIMILRMRMMLMMIMVILFYLRSTLAWIPSVSSTRLAKISWRTDTSEILEKISVLNSRKKKMLECWDLREEIYRQWLDNIVVQHFPRHMCGNSFRSRKYVETVHVQTA